jgi:hypothetical protein
MINDIESGVWPGVCMTRKVAPLVIKENFSNVKDVPKVIWLADGQKIRLHDTDSTSRGATLRVIHP